VPGTGEALQFAPAQVSSVVPSHVALAARTDWFVFNNDANRVKNRRDEFLRFAGFIGGGGWFGMNWERN
jgi:hypothetical protein